MSILSACTVPVKQAASDLKTTDQDCSKTNSEIKGSVQHKSPAPPISGIKNVKTKQQKCKIAGLIEITEMGAIKPNIQEAFDHSLALLEQQKYQAAIEQLIQVTQNAHKFTAPFINLGIAYAQLGVMEKAESSLQKALQLNQTHPVANNELGLVYRKTGRYTEAKIIYEALLKQYPEFLPARKNLGILCDIYLQDLVCALQQYEIFLKALPEDEKVNIWLADVKNRMK